MTSVTECEDFVIFGVRACDAASFKILDSVYLSEPVDTYYQNRREHGVVMTMSCTQAQLKLASARYSASMRQSRPAMSAAG